MSARITITTKIEKGKMTRNRSLLVQVLNSHEGKQVDITIERHRKKRSNPQNRWFHGVALPIIRQRLLELGWEQALSMEWVKDFIKAGCLIVDYVNEQTGEVVQAIGKTSELSTIEFCALKERVQKFCSEKLDIYIPDPGEDIQLFNHEN